MEWVEVKGPSVEVAVEAALAELGVSSPEEVEVEVLQQPEKGFLGFGRTDAVVRVKPIPKKRRRKRPSSKKRRAAPQTDGGKGGDDQKRSSGSRTTPKKGDGNGRVRRDGQQQKPPRNERPREAKPERERTVSREEQAGVVAEFLEGLLGAFGLEGAVETRVEDDIIFADIVGSETEALVGSRGVILQSIHELTKTVVQRKTQESARIRLDIAGYGERRREFIELVKKAKSLAIPGG